MRSCVWQFLRSKSYFRNAFGRLNGKQRYAISRETSVRIIVLRKDLIPLLKFSLILITEEAPQPCDVVRPAADIEDQYPCIITASFRRSGETKGTTSSRAFPKDFYFYTLSYSTSKLTQFNIPLTRRRTLSI